VLFVTGWTVPELRATPAPVVRALFRRIYAGLVWNPELAGFAARSVSRSSFASFSDYIAARNARATAAEIMDSITAELWPEDADA
jgi:hypothetical protein